MNVETLVSRSASIANRKIGIELSPTAWYHLKSSLALTSVPFLCGLVLTLLLFVFAKLNLYYLETNGLIIDERVREAYYSQVQGETMGVFGFLLLQLGVTAVVSAVVMRWSSAPFLNALRTLETATRDPANLRPVSRWLSESPYFDRVIWGFALKVKSGGGESAAPRGPRFLANLFFLVKFCVTFGLLSVVTGYFMGMTIGTVYEKIVNLAFSLVRNTSLRGTQHFFTAQQDILHDATTITMLTSIAIYFVIGLRISRYMTTMIFVFSRAIEEDRFPVQLRADDVYHELADALNRARASLR